MRFGPTFRSVRMRPADGPSNGSETLSRIQSLADYTIAMLESSFRKRHPPRVRAAQFVFDDPGPTTFNVTCAWGSAGIARKLEMGRVPEMFCSVAVSPPKPPKAPVLVPRPARPGLFTLVAAPPMSVMNSRRFNGSNGIQSPAGQGRIAGYRIG